MAETQTENTGQEKNSQANQQPPAPPEEDKGKSKAKTRPMRKIKFMNNEEPSADLEFTFVRKDGTMEQYRLFPGYEYNLPADVVKHLNSLVYPVYNTELDRITGQIYHKQVGTFNRFSCHPVE